jgi:glycosyltransferase involved in cell wall biosynthesis
MNILYLCDEYPPCQHGGIGTVTQNLARTIADMGHKVVVAGFYPYYRKSPEREKDQGVEVYRFFYGNRWKLKLSKHFLAGYLINIKNEFDLYIRELKKLVEEHNIEIIESTDFVEAFRYSGPRMISFSDFRVPFIVKLHGSYSIVYDFAKIKFGNRNIVIKEKTLLGSATALVAVSASVKQRVEVKYSLQKHIDVLYNGIYLDGPVSYIKNLNNNHVAFAGTLDVNKGVFNLLKAWPKVIKVVPSARLQVYGKGSKTSLNAINRLITGEIRDSIELKGYALKEDLPKIYSSVSCAIFPSYSETFGMAPLEAMAIGCPVIFTKRTSGPEIIDNGENGLLVDPDNIAEITDAIVFMLTNRTQAIEMGQKAYLKVSKEFDISIVAERHIKFYSGFLT